MGHADITQAVQQVGVFALQETHHLVNEVELSGLGPHNSPPSGCWIVEISNELRIHSVKENVG
jgi:hypothetical protein